MKNILIKNKKFFVKGILLFSIFSLIVLGCVYIDSISIMQIQEDGTEAPFAKAGSTATFTVKGHINSDEEHAAVQFVVAFLAPKSWNVRNHSEVTYITTLHTNPHEELTMSVIPESSLPKNADGLTWGQKLMETYGVGPNVLSDMEWVSFATDKIWSIRNGDKPTYTIYIKTNVGELNLKAYLGFFVNHTNDGISTDDRHRKVMYSSTPFEVTDGRGVIIDFCNEHFNKVQPLAILQDDFVTFSFNGGVYMNDLIAYDEIYLEAIAYDLDGAVISQITEKSAKTLLRRESLYTQTYSLTLWPADYFNVSDGKVIGRIAYIFTDKSGMVTITQSDDDFAVEGVSIPENKEPFLFDVLCE